MENEKPLIDAFVILGSQNELETETPTIKKPSSPNIIGVYPSSALSFLSDINLSYLCFPQGFRDIDLKTKNPTFQSQHEFRQATITNSAAEKKYVTSFLFYKICQKDHGRNTMLMPMSFCLISQIALFDFHKKWLTEAYKSYFGDKLQDSKEKLSLEFLISLIFHHLYFSIEFKKEVAIVYRVKDHVFEMFRYRNYYEKGITLPNFTFQTLLTCVSPLHLIDLVKLILLEKKIIIIRKNCNDNAILIESLLQLIQPFQWTFVNISYLTEEMLDYIDAPMPYMIGLSSDFRSKLDIEALLADNTAILDIDAKTLQYSGELPSLPEPEVNTVNNLLQSISQHSATKKGNEFFWISSTIKLKITFFEIFQSLLEGYLNFFSLGKSGNIRSIFQYSEFISSNSHQSFLESFAETQQFSVLYEVIFRSV